MTTKNCIKYGIRVLTSEISMILCDQLRVILRKEKLKAQKLRNAVLSRPVKLQNRCENRAKKLNITEPVDYKNRISDEKFEELLSIISSKIQKQDTLMREALPARAKLKIVLHYLTTGENFHILSKLYKMPKNSISQFLPNVCNAIFEGLQEYIQTPRDTKDWEKIQHEFETKWDFGTCCGAIDGCHIAVRSAKPQNTLSLMCVVDANYKLIHIDIQRHEDIQDPVEFSKTPFSKSLQQLKIPEKSVFVANSSFSQTDTILIPYDSANQTPIQDVFNYRLQRISRIAENTLGLLQWKFRVFDRPSSLKMDTIESVLKALCVLHNWLLNTTGYLNSEGVDSEDVSSGTIKPGEWRQQTSVNKIKFIKREGHPSAVLNQNHHQPGFVHCWTYASPNAHN